jgi:hypothetical protein
MQLDEIQPQEKAEEEYHDTAQTDGRDGEQGLHPVFPGEYSEEQDDRAYFKNEGGYEAKCQKYFGQATRYCCQPSGLLLRNSPDRIHETKYQGNRGRPGEQHAPKKSPGKRMTSHNASWAHSDLYRADSGAVLY